MQMMAGGDVVTRVAELGSASGKPSAEVTLLVAYEVACLPRMHPNNKFCYVSRFFSCRLSIRITLLQTPRPTCWKFEQQTPFT